MKIGFIPATVLVAVVLVTAPVRAADVEMELEEAALNRIVAQTARQSDGGVQRATSWLPGIFGDCLPMGYLECPTFPFRIPLLRCRRDGELFVRPGAAPVPWQWWIANPRFDVRPGGMDFTAEVLYRVDGVWGRVERTVTAKLEPTPQRDALRVAVGEFKVPIELGDGTRAVEVDVARHASLRFPIGAPELELPDLEGGARTRAPRVDSADVRYFPGKIEVRLDVRFD